MGLVYINICDIILISRAVFTCSSTSRRFLGQLGLDWGTCRTCAMTRQISHKCWNVVSSSHTSGSSVGLSTRLDTVAVNSHGLRLVESLSCEIAKLLARLHQPGSFKSELIAFSSFISFLFLNTYVFPRCIETLICVQKQGLTQFDIIASKNIKNRPTFHGKFGAYSSATVSSNLPRYFDSMIPKQSMGLACMVYLPTWMVDFLWLSR